MLFEGYICHVQVDQLLELVNPSINVVTLDFKCYLRHFGFTYEYVPNYMFCCNNILKEISMTIWCFMIWGGEKMNWILFLFCIQLLFLYSLDFSFIFHLFTISMMFFSYYFSCYIIIIVWETKFRIEHIPWL